jgi:predicted dehydrogenase
LAPILADRGIGAVAVLTPPNTHLEIASELAHAGKHVLLEKPLDVSTERAERLVAACGEAGVTLGVVLQHRFKPAAERLAAILRDRALGEIVNCSTSIRLWRPQSYYDEPGRGTRARDGGGVLLTQGIHTLDLMLSLAGGIVEVSGYARTTPVHRMETEDLVCAAVRFASGAVGVIDATTAAFPGGPERIELIGTLGAASLAGTALDVSYHDGRREQIAADASPGGTGADPMAFPHDYHLGVWRDFLDALNQGRPPRISGTEGLKVHRLIDALLEAGATGQKVRVR